MPVRREQNLIRSTAQYGTRSTYVARHIHDGAEDTYVCIPPLRPCAGHFLSLLSPKGRAGAHSFDREIRTLIPYPTLTVVSVNVPALLLFVEGKEKAIERS